MEKEIKTIIRRFILKRSERLYSVLLTEKQLKFLEINMPSGGWHREFCLNSEVFKKRKCKSDGKQYQADEVCSCFKRLNNPNA